MRRNAWWLGVLLVLAGVGVPVWAVPVEEGLIIHLRADSLDLNDGESVSQWADLATGDGVDGTLGAAVNANLPTYREGGYDGWPAVHFDSANTEALLSSSWTWDATQGVCVFMVCTGGEANSDRACFVGSEQGAVYQSFSCDVASTTSGVVGTGSGARYNNGWCLTSDAGPNPVRLGRWHASVRQIAQGGGYGSLVYAVDAFPALTLATNEPTRSIAFSASGNVIAVGNGRANTTTGWVGGSDWYTGDVAEIVVYNRQLSQAEMEEMLAYLRGEYEVSMEDVNPIMQAADPDVLLVGDTVWLYPTSGPRTQFFAYSSRDLVDWQVHGPILDFNDIGWIPAGKYAWAPGIIERDGVYYLYYSVGPKPSYIGVAWSYSPAGPFTDSGSALIADNGMSTFEAIDAMAFKDPVSGVYYLYAGGSAGSRLRVWELNDDMLSLKREISVSTPTNFTEGAFMHYRDGIYYLSYSHGRWNNETYSAHYGTSSSPTGPWTYRGAILETDAVYYGPGHHSFLYNGATDEWLIIYHRWDPVASWTRSVAVERLYYKPNGLIEPVVMTYRGVGPIPLGQWLAGDFNEDGVVNAADLAYLGGAWLTEDWRADVAPGGGDDFVNLADYEVLLRQWGQ